MKIIDKQSTEIVEDRVCDVCNESLMVNINGEKFDEHGELKAAWGYGSKQHGKCYHLDLCENCFTIALLALRDQRRINVMFNEDADLPDEHFGLDVSRSENDTKQ
jgi:hypothetical protein